MLTMSVGSKCAFVLPQKFINPHITPAIGLIINRFINTKSLVLVEEVWQFKGLKEDIKMGVFSSGRIKSNHWGWQAIPEITKDANEYMLVELFPDSIMVPSKNVLDSIISKAVEDFFRVNQEQYGKEVE